MTRLTIYISVVLCLIIVAGYVAGTKQEAGADNEPYGIYVLSVDPVQYIELRTDGSCIIGTRELGPSGGFLGSIRVFSGTYEIKGNILTIIGPEVKKLEWRIEGNTILPPEYKRGNLAMNKSMEGAKYIKR